ncbi:MAG TPA: RpiB/LacA/LacB family sugar-phosphate isomerase [Anaeromyxobacter sp.]|nr:RpiB/LacA/LacB family sugar-phosphate isomerase [Anaeromyxobacter sp.]
MRIAVLNETSAADRNGDILAALEGRGHELLNAGMRHNGEAPELQYVHTGLMAGLLLHLGRVDLVVGGCGTGQGFLNAVMQYPGVFCGHLLTPLDAWLFAQINDGNCISLMLNQGYGWASGVNLRLLFDAYFAVERGRGYPPHRQEPQRASRQRLALISTQTHRSWAEIVSALPAEVLDPALAYPGFGDLLGLEAVPDPALRTALLRRAPVGRR